MMEIKRDASAISGSSVILKACVGDRGDAVGGCDEVIIVTWPREDQASFHISLQWECPSIRSTETDV